MGRRTTQRGMGKRRDSTPTSGSRLTQRGLTNAASPKLITKRGLAPPSDPPPVWSSSADASPADGSPGEATEPPSPDVTRADAESSVVPLEPMQEGQRPAPKDRAQFKTAPGGGRNRVSGGRVAASAYVSPKTVAPAHAGRQDVALVEVHESVVGEARRYRTEPSLLRRRESSLPPAPNGPSRNALFFAVGLIASLALGAVAVWWLRSAEQRGAAGDPASGRPDAANSGNAPGDRPNASSDVAEAKDPDASTPSTVPESGADELGSESSHAASTPGAPRHVSTPTDVSHAVSPPASVPSDRAPPSDPGRERTVGPSAEAPPATTATTGQRDRELWLE